MIIAALLLSQLVSRNDLIGAAVILGCAVAAIIILYVKLVLPARKRDSEAYRKRTDKLIDESLGTWAHESIIARDRKRNKGRGRGHHARSVGVRE